MTNPDKKNQDTPAVRIPPPVIVVVFLIIGLACDHYMTTTFGSAVVWLKYVGIVLSILGLGTAVVCAVMYRKAETSILPHTADSNMIETGPFGWSRNPIYLSMLIVFVGISFIMDAPAALLFAVPVYLALRYYVIAREEAYLTRRFGDEYISYQSRVRRWF